MEVSSARSARYRTMRWRRFPFILLQPGLLGASATAAIAARGLVASERFSDQASLLITGMVGLVIVLAAAIATRAAVARTTWRMRLALAALPLGLLFVDALFVRASVMDASVEMEALVEADGPPTPPAAIVIGPGGHDVRLSGELGEGVARRLAVLLAEHPDVSRIHLTSEGGIADEGQALGDVIAAHRLDTFVPDYCVSACTLAFIRGRQRLMLEDARLGFHAPYEEGLFGAMYRGDASEQRAAYLAAGLAPDFVDAALKVDPAGIWYPPFDRLKASGVVTASVDHYQLPDSNLDGAVTLDGARALILHNFPIMSVFLKHAPQGVDAIAGWYLDGYLHAHSEGEDTDALKAIVRGAIAVGLSRADDATLVDLATYLERALRLAESPRACTAIGRRVDLITAMTELQDDEPATETVAAALFDRALNGRRTLDEGAIAKAVSVVASDEPTEPCRAWARMYADMLKRPSGEVAAAMRALIDAQAAKSLIALKVISRPHG